MKQTAVIMAGGRGERFWPQSRQAIPKQFLSLTSDGMTMLQHTVERLLKTVAIEDVFIATNAGYLDIVQKQLPDLPVENILCEPMAKNTAPCIAYAAAVITARYGDAVMYVMPSDHIVKNKALFRNTLALAGRIASEGENLVTLGITPDYPETGYGYIKFTECPAGPDNVYPVDRFVEKPDAPTAQQYFDEGTYLWNSGMFVWKASTFLSNLDKHLPEVARAARIIHDADGTENARNAVIEAFNVTPSVSVDYGVMEKAENIYTIPSSFGWDDVGSWLSLSRINKTDEKGNYSKGDVIALDCENSIIVSNSRLVTAVGVENLVVVETEDAIMICSKDDTQQVKNIVQALKNQNKTSYL